MKKIVRVTSRWAPKSTGTVARVMGVPPRQVPMRPTNRPAAPEKQPTDLYAPPACLYGDATIDPGTEAEVPTGTISNNSGRAIEVREIRFTADAPNTSSTFSNLGGILRAAITIGGKPVMSEPVPLWNLGRLDNFSAQGYVAAGVELATQYVWRLERPLVLPPRCAITAKFSHPGTVNFPIIGRIAILGKFADDRTPTTAVPYVLAWRSKESKIVADTDISDERALANTLGKTLHITRILARHASLCSGTTATPLASALLFSDGRTNEGNGAGVAQTMGLLRLKLHTSRNWPIINDYQPIWDVFAVAGAIEVPHLLPPGDFYKAAVKFYTSAPDSGLAPTWPGGTPLTYQHSLHLSFLGWREEALS
jgi:hypothetical protein